MRENMTPRVPLGMPYLLEVASVDEAAVLCRDLGFDFLEINLSFPPCRQALALPARLLTMLSGYGLDLTIHLDEQIDPFTLNDRVRQAHLDSLAEDMTNALGAGAKRLVMHWQQGIKVTLPDRLVVLHEAYLDAYTAHVRALRELIDSHLSGTDTLLVIENTGGFKPFEQEAIEHMLQSACVGLCLDTGHMAGAGNKDAAFYGRHPDQLRHMHLHDAKGSACHLPLGEGALDIKELLALAGEKKASVVLEVKTLSALRQSLRYLKQLEGS